jgi:fructosamine-3-kinase
LVTVIHPLLETSIVREVERAASAHLGRRWVGGAFTNLNDRACHPCGVIHGRPFSVFAKLNVAADDGEQFRAELNGLNLLRRLARVATPTPVANGVIAVQGGSLLLLESLPERSGSDRSTEDWRSIGRTLATMHLVRDKKFGLGLVEGFFGPTRQDNRAVPSNRWADFYAERRVLPLLRLASDSGHLPLSVAADVERLMRRLPELCGPEPRPSLLHGDAHQNNFISTPAGAVVVDVAPHFGHPEVDLALVDYFEPVPEALFDGYRDLAPIDHGFPHRRELWRLYGYLSVIAVDGGTPIGRQFVKRLADAVRFYER